MQSLFDAWQNLLQQHKTFLLELESSLNLEKEALIANDIGALRESSVAKDKASRKLKLLQQQISDQKAKTIGELGLVSQPSTLGELFIECFDEEQREQLDGQRNELKALSQSISKVNSFNHGCLKTYRSYVDGVRGIFSDARMDNMPTYDAVGQKSSGDKQGRLLNRSC